jgi:hypothetical protein
MLSSRNAKPEVCRQFQRWPPPPSLKLLKCRKSAIYHPILIKFGTQAKKNLQSSTNTKPGGHHHFGKRPPQSCKSMKLCESAFYFPILMIFGTHTKEKSTDKQKMQI